MKDKKDMKINTYDTYKKIRKPMPPSEKVIIPKNEFRRERFNWRKEIEDNDNP